MYVLTKRLNRSDRTEKRTQKKIALMLITIMLITGLNISPVAAAIDTTNQIGNIYSSAVPSGGVTPATNVYQTYTYTFTASQASTPISLLFRKDPGFFYLDDVSVKLNGTGSELIKNGNFESVYTIDSNSFPKDWNLIGAQGLSSKGVISTEELNHVWGDGAVGGFDGIQQIISTTPGSSYTVTFKLKADSWQGVEATTTNPYSGNITQVLVYAGDIPAGLDEYSSIVYHSYDDIHSTDYILKTEKKQIDTTIYVLLTAGTRANHTFKGWSTISGSNTVNYAPGSEFNLNEFTELYAVWDQIAIYDVTFINNGSNYQTVSAQSGTALTKPTDPTKATVYYDSSNNVIAGASDTTPTAVKKIVYTFAGWKTTGGQYWDFSTPVTSAMTLTSDYSQTVSYKISFDKNNSSSSYPTTNQWIEAGSHITAPLAPSNVNTGSTTYYFAGWNTSSDGTGEYWNFSGGVVNTYLTLYAQWTTVKSYSIEFDDNLTDPVDDFVWHTGATQQNSIAATGRVTAPTMSRVDYVFDGWYTSADSNASVAFNLIETPNKHWTYFP